MYVAFDLSSGRTKTGFSSVEDAENYILSFCCDWCRQDIEQGYIEIEQYEKLYILSVLSTPCGSEWDIISHEEYNELLDC